MNLKQELEFMCPKVSILGSEKLHQSSLGRWEWGVAAGCEGQADGLNEDTNLLESAKHNFHESRLPGSLESFWKPFWRAPSHLRPIVRPQK